MNFKAIIAGLVIGTLVALSATAAEARSKVSSKGYSSSSSKSYSRPKSSVSSKPRQTTAPRRAPAPTAQRPTVQKNYYNNNSRSYNSGGYRGNNYGGGMGGGGGVGMGGAILGGAAGAVGGMMLMDALTEDEGEKALKLQQQQQTVNAAKEEQARDDKMDQILENQKEAVNSPSKMIPEPSDDFFKVNPQHMQ